eukprot:scaffold278616_cov23-Tisochrysis_lutea.AAC.1
MRMGFVVDDVESTELKLRLIERGFGSLEAPRTECSNNRIIAPTGREIPPLVWFDSPAVKEPLRKVWSTSNGRHDGAS